MRFFARLDAFATDDPDFNEGRYTDRCPLALCERPVIDQPCWRHRVAALVAILIGGRIAEFFGCTALGIAIAALLTFGLYRLSEQFDRNLLGI